MVIKCKPRNVKRNPQMKCCIVLVLIRYMFYVSIIQCSVCVSERFEVSREVLETGGTADILYDHT